MRNVQHFDTYSYSISSRELEEKMNTTPMSVHYLQSWNQEGSISLAYHKEWDQGKLASLVQSEKL